MKRIAAVLAVMLLLTACSTSPVQEVFQPAGQNLLEITYDGHTIDLSQKAVEVINQLIDSGGVVLNTQFFQQYGKNGTLEKWESQDERGEILFFENMTIRRRTLQEYAVKYPSIVFPAAGIQELEYVFDLMVDDGTGSLNLLTNPDGTSYASALPDMNHCLSIGKYGRAFSNAPRDEIQHYVMFLRDGQPVDLESYVQALPETLEGDTFRKNVFSYLFPEINAVVSRTYSVEEIPESVEQEYREDQEFHAAFAVGEALFDSFDDLNRGVISSIGVIDYGLYQDQLVSAVYNVYRYYTFKAIKQ